MNLAVVKQSFFIDVEYCIVSYNNKKYLQKAYSNFDDITRVCSAYYIISLS